MAIYQEQELEELSQQFQIYGDILHAEPCKIGHINETYAATYNQGGTLVRYIHQKVNQTVFKDPEAVMDNLVRVTSHLRTRLLAVGTKDITRKALTVVPTRGGQSFYRDAQGECWRTFVFVERAQSFEAAQSTRQAHEAGRAFGRFQALLVDLPGKRLVETIPDFHHSRKRFQALHQALNEDRFNRARSAASEIKFALAHEPLVDVLLRAMQQGEVPERIAHNDTKFNNVMLDWETGEAMCVVDLDTVMPGSVLYDFGDMVRTTTSPTLEDEEDLAKVRCQVPMFDALLRGYLEEAREFLTPAERDYLVFSGQLITFTIGIRFLTDYLRGDKYFRIHRPDHNLDRSRTQFRLVESIVAQQITLERLVRQYWNDGTSSTAPATHSAAPSRPAARPAPARRPAPHTRARKRPARVRR